MRLPEKICKRWAVEKKQTLQSSKIDLKKFEKSLEDSWVCVYSFGQWPKCLKKKNLLRKFSKIWYCREVPFQVWKSGLSRNFLAKVKSDPKLNKSNLKIIHFRKPKYIKMCSRIFENLSSAFSIVFKIQSEKMSKKHQLALNFPCVLRFFTKKTSTFDDFSLCF